MKAVSPEPEPCPICKLPGGFHDHRGVAVPRRFAKSKGWEKVRD